MCHLIWVLDSITTVLLKRAPVVTNTHPYFFISFFIGSLVELEGLASRSQSASSKTLAQGTWYHKFSTVVRLLVPRGFFIAQLFFLNDGAGHGKPSRGHS